MVLLRLSCILGAKNFQDFSGNSLPNFGHFRNPKTVRKQSFGDETAPLLN